MGTYICSNLPEPRLVPQGEALEGKCFWPQRPGDRKGGTKPLLPDPPASAGVRTGPAQDRAPQLGLGLLLCVLEHILSEGREALCPRKSFSPQKGPGVFNRLRSPTPGQPDVLGWGSRSPLLSGPQFRAGGGCYCGGATPSAPAVSQPPPQVRPLPKCSDLNLPLRLLQISHILRLAAPRPLRTRPWSVPSVPQIPESLVRPPPAPAPSCRCRMGTRADTSASGAPGPRRSGSHPASPWPLGAPKLGNRRDRRACAPGPGACSSPRGRAARRRSRNPPLAGVWDFTDRESETLTRAGTTWVFSSDPAVLAAVK